MESPLSMHNSATEQPRLPSIEVLTSFAPTEVDGLLTSTKLQSQIAEYGASQGDMWGVFESSEPGGIHEADAARKLASFYLLKTGAQIQFYGRDTQLWNERFNNAVEEIYGTVDTAIVGQLASTQLQSLEAAAPDSWAVATYRKLTGNTQEQSDGNTAEVRFEQLKPMAELLKVRFTDVYDVIDELASDGPYDSAQVREIFGNVLQRMSMTEPSWNDWKITNSPTKTMLNVIASKKEIDIPDKRSPVESRSQLLGLALHEIGVHATRSMNGYKTNDDLMSIDMPGYSDFEEGLGVLIEYLATGVIPTKNIDRYIDVALASGAVPGVQLSREELIRIGIERTNIRNGKSPSADISAKELADISSHVNRIFRGGNGAPIRDADDAIISQAVFTKDFVYHQGFVWAATFVAQHLEAGIPSEKILDYLLAGKFNPLDGLHESYVAKRYGLQLGAQTVVK